MTTQDEADAISQRMAELRRDLTGDVREISRNARVVTDWTFYVRRFPWVMVGLGVLSGYALVPRKKAVISPDQEALAEMVRKKQLRLDVDHKREKPGILATLLTMAATGMAKVAMGYMSERMRVVAHEKSHQSSRAEAVASSSVY